MTPQKIELAASKIIKNLFRTPERFHSLICRSRKDLLKMKAQKKTKYPINSNSSPEPFVMDQLEIMIFEISAITWK